MANIIFQHDLNRKNAWAYVAENFQIFIQYQTEDEKRQMTWVLEIIKNEDKGNPIFIEALHDEFCSSKKLKNIFARHCLSLKVSDDELSELQDYLFNETKLNGLAKLNVLALTNYQVCIFFRMLQLLMDNY